MRLNVIAISIEDPTEHVVGAVLSELLNLTFGDGQLTPPMPEGSIAGEGAPSPSLAAAGGDIGAEASTPPPRPAAPRPASAGTGNPSEAEAKTQASVSASRKPGMLATEEEQRHFRNHHGGAAKAGPRVVKPGELPAALRSLKVGEEFIIMPRPKAINGVSRHISRLRADGTIDKRIAVGWDADGEVRVIFHSEQQA